MFFFYDFKLVKLVQVSFKLSLTLQPMRINPFLPPGPDCVTSKQETQQRSNVTWVQIL